MNVTSDEDSGSVWTSSSSYTSLSGGPSATVSITSSGSALVFITGQLNPQTGETAFMGFSVSGASSRFASDQEALIREHGTSSSTGYVQATATYHVTGLNSGSNTFTAQYKAAGGSVNFLNRSIVVMPLP